MTWGAAALAGGSMIASRVQGYKARRHDQTMASNQMNFQAYMSNTEYQRAMADMKAAGLNPMLAYSQGGASTPSGASPPGAENIGSEAMSSALQAYRMKKEIDLLEENTRGQKLKNDRFSKFGEDPWAKRLDSLIKVFGEFLGVKPDGGQKSPKKPPTPSQKKFNRALKDIGAR